MQPQAASNPKNRRIHHHLPETQVFYRGRPARMPHGVAGPDEIVPEGAIDQSRKCFPEGVGADFSGAPEIPDEIKASRLCASCS